MNELNGMKVVRVLLVEDSEADARLTMEALKESKLRILFDVVNDGVAAVDFLRKTGQYKNAERPDVIILDLNLPKKDGREVLADIKTDPKLLSIPVVIVTSSKAEADIVKCYDLHANCFITKPIDLDQFIEVVKTIEAFWFTVVKLPGKQ